MFWYSFAAILVLNCSRWTAAEVFLSLISPNDVPVGTCRPEMDNASPNVGVSILPRGNCQGVIMTHLLRAHCVAMFLFAASLITPARGEDDRWADFRFLIKSWVSEGSLEQGSGSFSLEPDLKNNVLVRRNIAFVPGGKGRQPQKHEDLMVIYRDRGAKEFRASYFDSEGHVIQYSVNSLPANRGLVFVSAPELSAPRFRLTYTKAEADKVAIEFEIAPPGQPDRFRKYLGGTVVRKPSGH